MSDGGRLSLGVKFLPLFLALLASAVAGSPDQTLAALERQGGASYADLSRAFYGEQTATIFAAKVAYQQAHPEINWLADYATASRRIPLTSLPANHLAWQNGAEGNYDSRTDSIILRAGGQSPSNVIHELGHATQRARLLAQGPHYEAALQRMSGRLGWSECNRMRYPAGVARLVGRGYKFSSHRFVEYLCKNVEFEVRLQAMNRYYFAKRGRAILTPVDARDCLALAGVEHEADLLRLYREVFELPKVRAILLAGDGVEQAAAFWDDLINLSPGHA